MKNRKVAGLRLLPAEFEIRKYAACQDFSLSDWAIQIARRVWVRETYSMIVRNLKRHADSAEDAAKTHSLLLEEAIDLLSEPLARNESLQDVRFDVGHDHGMMVRDMDVLDYMSIRHEKDPYDGDADPMASYDEPYTRWSQHEESRASDAAMLAMPYWEVRDAMPDGRNIVASHGNIFLSVNLHAPEEQLRDEFVRWVRRTKEALSIPAERTAFNDVDVRRWQQYQILAYFDVTHWLLVTGESVTDNHLGVSLFPDDVEMANPPDRIRKTVRPLADKMFTRSMAAALVEQAIAVAGRVDIPGSKK